MRHIGLLGMLLVGISAYAAPPPDAGRQYRDWFRSLTVPGIPGAICCTVADCRMVDARWNDRTQHYEAQLARETFSNALRAPVSQEDNEAYSVARSAWMNRWVAKFGDIPNLWIEVPETKVNTVQNPTGHAVLCWSLFNDESNGVYCFIPFRGAFDNFADHTRWYG